jgi:hypothetical protein
MTAPGKSIRELYPRTVAALESATSRRTLAALDEALDSPDIVKRRTTSADAFMCLAHMALSDPSDLGEPIEHLNSVLNVPHLRSALSCEAETVALRSAMYAMKSRMTESQVISPRWEGAMLAVLG